VSTACPAFMVLSGNRTLMDCVQPDWRSVMLLLTIPASALPLVSHNSSWW